MKIYLSGYYNGKGLNEIESSTFLGNEADKKLELVQSELCIQAVKLAKKSYKIVKNNFFECYAEFKHKKIESISDVLII